MANQYYKSICDCLKSNTVEQNITKKNFDSFPKIRMVEMGIKVEDNSVYIGNQKDVCKLLKEVQTPTNSLFCIADYDGELQNIKKYHSYIVTDMSLPSLYNKISAALQGHNESHKEYIRHRKNYRAIFSGKITDPEVIENVIEDSIKEFGERYNIAIIFFEENNSMENIAKCLRDIKNEMPSCFAYIEDDKVVVIYSHSNRNLKFPKELRGRIERILNRYDGYMAISTDSGKFQRMREEYEVAVTICSIVGQMNLHNEGRVFTNEEYGLHFVLSKCCEQYSALFNSPEAFYKGHPAIVTLKEYDKEHNSDLCEILYQYLLNGMSISDTAEAVFAHRNTIHNKIKKIMTIIDDDLDDGRIRFNLFFAFILNKYYEHY